MQTQKYLYRRQYVLGPPASAGCIPGHSIAVADGYHLTSHPDLEVTKASAGGNWLVLLGYLLDPYAPGASNEAILQEVLGDTKTPDDILSLLCNKCGRYVVIAKTGDELRMFSDAVGMRQIFYCKDAAGNLWCASQPHILAQCLGIGVDETIRSDLSKTALFASQKYWYPGSLTLFSGIYHLMPNHYLHLHNKEQVRYWPNRRLSPVPLEECVAKSGELLSRIIDSASRRFSNLAFAVSSGLDSRVLLAASRGSSGKITYFTHLRNDEEKSEPSLSVPSQLCNTLGLSHLYVHEEQVDGWFEQLFNANVFTARRSTMSNAFAIYKQFELEEKDLTIIYGNCAEITKRDRSRYPKLPDFLITGASITEMALLSQSTRALQEFEGWLASLRSLAQKCNLDVLDLLHWEHRVGSWAAMSFHEYETAFEIVCPYSCRRYIELLLGVPFKYRTKPDYLLQKKIASALWPETLGLPINPGKGKVKHAVEEFLYRTNLYDVLKYLLMMCYRRHKAPGKSNL